MKRILTAAALCAAATFSVAAMASVGSPPQQQTQISAAQRAGAVRALDKLAKPDAPNYTRVADDYDEDGACWASAAGYVTCGLSPRSMCISGMFVKKVFISGGNCDKNENPWGG